MRTGIPPLAAFPFLILPLFSSAAETSEKNLLEVEGRLLPGRDIAVTSKITSRVEKILVREGDSVKNGDNLIELNAEDAERKLKLAEIAFQREKVMHKKIQLEFERLQDLHKRGPPIDEELERAKSDLAVADLAVQEAKVNLEQMRTNLESAVVRAPISGMVTGIAKDDGDQTTAGEELLHIIDARELLLVTRVDSGYYGKIRTGMDMTFKTHYAKETFKTRVESIVPFSEEGKSFKITALVSNNGLKLLPGTKVSCFIKLR